MKTIVRCLVLVFSLFTSMNPLLAQWVHTNSFEGSVQALAVSGTNLFAGTYEGDIWRRPVSEMITSAEELPADLPTHFTLAQNYPNPFNPSTTISFSIPASPAVYYFSNSVTVRRRSKGVM